MAVVDDVDQLIEQYHLALDEFVKGTPEPVKKLFSHRDDVTLSNLQTRHRGDKRYRDISRYIVKYCRLPLKWSSAGTSASRDVAG